MTKYLIFLLISIALQFSVTAAEGPDFEAELRALENAETKSFDQQMKAVEALSVDSVEDAVSVNQAAVKKEEKPAPLIEETLASPQKSRRVRSR